MIYSELSQFMKYNALYTFYKGVCGGLQELTQVFANSLEGAKKTAIINGIRNWDFIVESKLVL